MTTGRARRPPPRSRSATMRYLSVLFAGAPAGAYIEVRWRANAGMARTFVPIAEHQRVEGLITQHAPSTDLYVGVIPRRRHRGGRDDIVDHATVAWVDCDTTTALRSLRAFSLAPSILVRSGTVANCHAYWLLNNPEPTASVEYANGSLAAALRADAGSADIARILRPPGSLNHKAGRGVAVRLERCDPSLSYSLAEILEATGRGPSAPPVPRRRGRRVTDDPLLAIAPSTYIERLSGLRVPRHHKVSCPFHEDGSPSLHVYSTPSRGWYCFGCRRGGSIYDFAAALWQRSTRGADFILIADALADIFEVNNLAS